jgi:hypothetical protein
MSSYFVQRSLFPTEQRFPSSSSSSTSKEHIFPTFKPADEYPSVGGRISRLDTPSKAAPSKGPVFAGFWAFFDGLSIVDKINKYNMRLDLLVSYIKAKQALTSEEMYCDLQNTLNDLKKLLKGETIVDKSRRNGLYQPCCGAGVVMDPIATGMAVQTHIAELHLISDLFDHSSLSAEQKREFFYDLREEILSLHVCLIETNPKTLDQAYFGSEERARMFLTRAVNIVSAMQEHFTY